MVCKVGIDVGGTFTDAVLINNNQVEKKGKVPTKSDDLLETIVNAVDILEISNYPSISEVTVSTTLVTNAILQERFPEVKLVLFPGSGMKLSSLPWPVDFYVLSGELDYRGREVKAPQQSEWKELVDYLKEKGSPLVAVVGKFSHRNKIHEEQLAAYLKKEIPAIKLALGNQWGQTNFFRRSLTTYVNLASQQLFTEFALQLKEALIARGCRAPIRVLKADGGVLPLEKIRPVESIYSGPAASVLGALAQNNPEDSFIVVDIGGTTTDIGLVLSGAPLISSRGAQIGSYYTTVRSLAVRSVPIGGDSAVLSENGKISLASYRLGPAYCLGGNNPTPTDAMRYLNLTQYGNYERAEESLANLLPPEKREPFFIRQTAQTILEQMVNQIGNAIEQLRKEWEDEPAYKVWEVLHPHQNIQFNIFLSGGGAPGVAAALEKRMKTSASLVDSSDVSNAIGAAMAKPTFSWTLHLDTYIGKYRIEETGEQGNWIGSKKPHREVEHFLKELATKQAAEMGIEISTLQKEPFDYFPLIQNYETVGQIIRGAMHVPPGVTGRVK